MKNKVGPIEVSDRTLLIGGGVLLVTAIGAAWYVKHKAGQAIDAATDTAKDVAEYVRKDAVNVTSPKNVVNTAVTTVGQATGVLGTNDLTGKPNTLGSALYESRKIGGWLYEALH